MTVLTDRALGRATLARQLLLDPADMPVEDAVAHLGGLQAHQPQEPFVGLWSRLRAFDPSHLSGLLIGRRVVRTHLMRRTIHLVTADDALAWRSRHDTMLRQRVLGTYRRELAGVDLDELAAAGRVVMADAKPRTMSELVRAVEGRWPTAPEPLRRPDDPHRPLEPRRTHPRRHRGRRPCRRAAGNRRRTGHHRRCHWPDAVRDGAAR